ALHLFPHHPPHVSPSSLQPLVPSSSEFFASW
ncbi:hypothetical protein A2U01_0071656, partial [Trifolium medium]|nr:hypothetical protein [Trifolium medium]